ncbi:MAG: glycosyltransferase family 87 protein [Bacteroidia bacterium]
MAITFNHPIGDFGNYYYGSKFFREGIDPLKFYQDIHFFNEQIKNHESGTFFENYAPVPPFSLIFYWPFTFLKLAVAKFIFSLIGLIFFCFSLERLTRKLEVFNFSFYLLPIIFLLPLHSNFHQGQTYLLITALLFEFYIALQDDEKMRLGIIIAVLFALKIFPAFIAIIFFFKKDWKTIGWIVLFTSFVLAIVYFFISNRVADYYYLQVFPRLALNDITEPFSYYNQSVYTFLLNAFVFHPYLNPSPLIDSTIIAVIIQLLFYGFVSSVFVTAILKKNVFVSFVISLLVLALLNKYSTVYGLVVFFPFIFLKKEISIKKMAVICLLFFLACNIPFYKLSSMPLIFQYPRPWFLLAIFVILVRELKMQFDLKYFSIALVIFILPALVFYKYQTENTPEFRPKTGIVYDFDVDPTHIKLFTCIGNRDTVEVFNFRSASIDSTAFRSLNHKAIYVNNKYLIQLCDKNTGVGMYYVKLIEPHRIE